MNFDAFAEQRRLSIYGAMIAIQVREHMREGRGAPGEADMCGFIEEAEAIVCLHEAVTKVDS